MNSSATVSASPAGASLIALTDSEDRLDIRKKYQYLSRQLSLMYQEADPRVDPYKILKILHSRRTPQLVTIIGNRSQSLGLLVEWSKALGATKQPCILLLSDTEGFSISSKAAAHQALLEKYGAPFIGILQIGGTWNPVERRCDGLAWCGWWQGFEASSISKEISELETSFLIRKRWSQVINDNLFEG
uniref:Uncharacterized protein n=1 Tax=Paulinella longichromatophora TaxID=1708747 RepID=A0A2H4ZQD9_9EUKA|nr:hypothetical protein PLO_756 [Paulinella longichromatophora]